MSRLKVFGAQVHQEVVTVWGPDEITANMVRDLNFRTALALSGHSGTVRWGAGPEAGFDGYISDPQSFIGEAGGGRAKTNLADDGLPGSSGPSMSPMKELLLGQVGAL